MAIKRKAAKETQTPVEAEESAARVSINNRKYRETHREELLEKARIRRDE